jgi:hypothetical protein
MLSSMMLDQIQTEIRRYLRGKSKGVGLMNDALRESTKKESRKSAEARAKKSACKGKIRFDVTIIAVIIAGLSLYFAYRQWYVVAINNLPDIRLYEQICEYNDGTRRSVIFVENNGGGFKQFKCQARAMLTIVCEPAHSQPVNDFLELRPVNIYLRGYYDEQLLTGATKGVICRVEPLEPRRIVEVNREIESQNLQTCIRLVNKSPWAYVKVAYQDNFGHDHTQYYDLSGPQMAVISGNAWEMLDGPSIPAIPRVDIQSVTSNQLIKTYKDCFKKRSN